MEWKNASAVMQGAGTLMSATASYGQGAEQNQMFKQRAMVDVLQARQVGEATTEAVRQKHREKRQALATAASQFGHGGVKPNLVVMAEIASRMEKDAAVIAQEGDAARRKLLSQAIWEKKMGKSRYRAGLWGAGTSLLTGGAKFAKNVHDYGLSKKK